MAASGFIAIGSGPAGLSAAETFRSRHRHIPVRILSADPALPYAKPPLSKEYLCGGQTELDLHSAGWFVRNDVDLIRGVTVERIDLDAHEVITAGGVHFPYWHLVLSTGETLEGDVVVAATGVRPDIRLAIAAGLATRDGRVLVDEHMHTSARNMFGAGDITLALNVAAGARVISEHWRDAAQQGRVAGLTAAGYPAAWDMVSGFTCTIGKFRMTYRGWSGSYDLYRLVDQPNGFSVDYEADGSSVGTLLATTSPAS